MKYSMKYLPMSNEIFSEITAIEEEREFNTGNGRLVDYFDNEREMQKGRCQMTKG